jgi:hypothetical protein
MLAVAGFSLGVTGRRTRRAGPVAVRAVALGLVAFLLSAGPAFAGWSAPRRMVPTGPLSPTAVSCASATFCVAVDSRGNASTWNGSTWTAPGAIAPGTWLTSVSCPLAGACTAVGFGGTVVTLSHGAWSGPATIGGGQNLFSVSCPSTSFCVAGGARSVLVEDGGRWQAVPGLPSAQYQSVSCASRSMCLVVNGTGETTLYNGRAWTRGPSTGLPFQSSNSVSCVSARFCATAGEDFLGAAAAVFDGRRWAAVPVSDNAGMTTESLSCASSHFCMAVGYNSEVPPGTDLAPGQIWQSDGTTFNGTVSDRYVIDAVSCPSASFCMALDSRGNFLRWTAPDRPAATSARTHSVARRRGRRARRASRSV